jgi:hypothetical protein
MFREVGTQVSLLTMSRPSPRTIAPPRFLPLDIKDLLKEDAGLFFDGGADGRVVLMGVLIGGLLAE